MNITRRQALSNSTLALLSLPSVLRLSPTAHAQNATFDYYIGPNGNNNNPGTLSAPWAITAINTKAATIKSKRIGLLDGTYRVPTSGVGSWPNAWLTLGSAAAGTSGAPTVIEAVNPHRAIITGNDGNGNYIQQDTAAIKLEGAWTQIKNIRFYQFQQWPIFIFGDNILVEGCDFEDLDRRRISGSSKDNCSFIGGYVANNQNVTIRNCRFADAKNSNWSSGGGERGGGVLIYNQGNITIEYCTFYLCEYAFYPKRDTAGYIFRNNFVRDNPRAIFASFHGNTSFGGSHCEMYNNIFLNCAQMNGWGLEAGMSALSVNWHHNTVYRAAALPENGLSYARGATANTRNHTVHSNIFYSGGTPTDGWMQWSSDYRAASACMDELDRNFYSPFKMWDQVASINTTSISAWRSGTGKDANSIAGGNPNFVNVSGTTPEDFKLQASSPCMGTGKDGTNMGAWDGRVTQIGCNFSAVTVVRPMSPQLSVL